MYRATHSHHEYMNERPSKFVMDALSFLNLPSKVKKSVFYFLKQENNNNLRTKSARKMIVALILATRAQKYVLSIKEIQNYFYERYDKKFKWTTINRDISKYKYRSLPATYYIECELSKLDVDEQTRINIRKNIVMEKSGGKPIVDAQTMIYKSMYKLGLVWSKKNRESSFHYETFSSAQAIRKRFPASKRGYSNAYNKN